ncbi:glycosyltransferase family 4 protein [Pedobacter mucosus]|uniref:glycosyltransferase family 4 protein n=1 Tax=Pedobacter mucosus TaxID=2895286 RepID=UPI001EE4CB34|nr:glycosyltransferase family 4 protein [Pedobacter mucosus]UKT66154.1 glycosyltransferase family 4 protein [Pedobacter mucosus]
MVFYTWGKEGADTKYDPAFKKFITWDLPLLEAYKYQFVENTAKNPGSHHFIGIVNPYLVKSIGEFQPDAILVYGWAYQSHLTILRYFKGKIPVWFRGDSTLLDSSKGFKKILRNLFLKWIYHYIDQAFYVGKANKAYFKNFGLKETQLIFAPHAIENDRFGMIRAVESKALRNSLNVLENEILILFAGKLEDKKNPLLLLSAFKKLNKANTHLLYVGNGFLEKELKEKAFRHFGKLNTGLAQDDKPLKIHFMDFQNQTQMPMIYQACDLFCLPSQGPGETWGLAVNEAMACGKALLVSDKVGCAENLVENGINGYIFESNSQSDLQEKLTLLINNKSLLKKMGKKSAQIIKDWSIEMQADTMLKELNK